jgi:hypothetical protein
MSERTGGTAMKKVSGPQVVTTAEAVESSLPAEIQEALGELVGTAREGLLALSAGVGLRVVHELMETEVVRHEALLDRAGVRPRRWAVAAAPRS